MAGALANSSVCAVHAADMIEEAPPAFDWTGLYVGANIGGGGGGNDRVGFKAPGYIADFGNLKPDGFFGGAQVGYNWQVEHLLLGIEADIQLSGLKDDDNVTQLGTTVSSTSDVKWFGTVRPRVGFVIDRALVYGTGGFAFGGVDYTLSSTVPASTVRRDTTYAGWTAGGGVEYAFTDKWSGKLEYQFIDLGRKTVGNGTISTEATPNFHTIRAGLNYHF